MSVLFRLAILLTLSITCSCQQPVGAPVIARKEDNMFHPGEVMSLVEQNGEIKRKVAFPNRNTIHDTKTYKPFAVDTTAIIPDTNPVYLGVSNHVIIKDDNSGPFGMGFVISRSAIEDGSATRYTFQVQSDSNTKNTYNVSHLRYIPNKAISAQDVGARVFALKNGRYYRGFVIDVEGTPAQRSIRLDDGSTIQHPTSNAAAVILDELPEGSELNAGGRVIAFKRGSANTGSYLYFSKGRIQRKLQQTNGCEKYRVKFDDDSRESMCYYQIRVLPA